MGTPKTIEVEMKSGDFGTEIFEVEAVTKGELKRKIDEVVDSAEKRNHCAFLVTDWWIKGTR